MSAKVTLLGETLEIDIIDGKLKITNCEFLTQAVFLSRVARHKELLDDWNGIIKMSREQLKKFLDKPFPGLRVLHNIEV